MPSLCGAVRFGIQKTAVRPGRYGKHIPLVSPPGDLPLKEEIRITVTEVVSRLSLTFEGLPPFCARFLFKETNIPIFMLQSSQSPKVGNYSVDIRISIHFIVIADFEFVRRRFVSETKFDSNFKHLALDSAFRKLPLG